MSGIIEEIQAWIDLAVYDIAIEVYNHEINFNNADPTSGQQVHSLNEIEDMVRTEMRCL